MLAVLKRDFALWCGCWGRGRRIGRRGSGSLRSGCSSGKGWCRGRRCRRWRRGGCRRRWLGALARDARVNPHCEVLMRGTIGKDRKDEFYVFSTQRAQVYVDWILLTLVYFTPLTKGPNRPVSDLVLETINH